MIKKIFFLLICVVFVFSGCTNENEQADVYQTIVNRDKIIVGTHYDAKPFGFIDKDGTLKGVDIDVSREIARRLLGSSNKVVFKQVTPANRIQSITTGDVDIVVATMSITPQRKMIVDFSDPYYIAGQAILLPASSKIKNVNDLNNENVIVIMGTTGEKSLRYFAPAAILQGYKNYIDAFNAFKLHKGVAITTDDSLLRGFVMDNKGYKILPQRLTQEPYGIAFKNSEETITLKTNLNRIVNDMRTDGFISKTKRKWGLN